MRKLSFNKRWLLCLLILSISIFVVGCDQKGSSENTETGDQITVKFSHSLTEDSGNGQTAIDFKEKLEELTDGEIQVDIFPNMQLGSMREQVEQTQTGSIEILMTGSSIVTPFVSDMAVLDLPFLFPDNEAVYEVQQSDIGEDLLAKFDDVGLKGLNFMAHGFRHMTTKDFPIESPEDIKGVKVRVMASDLLVDTFNNWGANATPIDFNELYNSLQQGVVDAQDNDHETFYHSKLYETQNNLTLTGHHYLTYLLLANKDWYEGLSPEHQAAFKEASDYARDLGFERSQQSDEEYLEKLKSEGMTVTELPEDAKQQFIELSQPVYDKYLDTDFKQEIFDRIQEKVGN